MKLKVFGRVRLKRAIRSFLAMSGATSSADFLGFGLIKAVPEQAVSPLGYALAIRLAEGEGGEATLRLWLFRKEVFRKKANCCVVPPCSEQRQRQAMNRLSGLASEASSEGHKMHRLRSSATGNQAGLPGVGTPLAASARAVMASTFAAFTSLNCL